MSVTYEGNSELTVSAIPDGTHFASSRTIGRHVACSRQFAQIFHGVEPALCLQNFQKLHPILAFQDQTRRQSKLFASVTPRILTTFPCSLTRSTVSECL